MTVGLELRALRKRKGLTLREFGALCGISGDELGRYERGEKNPRQANTQKIALALGEPVQAVRNGFVWIERGIPGEPEGRRDALRDGVLELLRENYGILEAGTCQDGHGAPCYTAGSPPEAFAVYEEDLDALTESIRAAVLPFAEHLKDVRPEAVIQKELLEALAGTPPEESAGALTDGQWQAIQDLLPPEKAGRGRAYKDNRLVLEGILYRMRTGVPWRKLPERYGRPRCICDRLRQWNASGLWPEVLARMLALGILREDEIAADGAAFRKWPNGSKRP